MNDYDTQTLKQGLQFKQHRQKQLDNILAKGRNNYIESFANQESSNTNNTSNTKTSPSEIMSANMETMNEMHPNTQQNINALLELEQLKTQYDSLQKQYESVQTGLSTKTDMYLMSNSADNPYAGNNVLLKSSGALGYVTNKGVFKWYNSWDTVDATSGKNGCPILRNGNSEDYMTLDTKMADKYDVVGTVLSRNPRIVVGNPMVTGQTCGNENKNVYVSGAAPPNVTYDGCYKDKSKTLLKYQTDGVVFDYNSCMQRAMDTNSKYFSLQAYKTDTKLSKCYVSNDYEKAISKGDANSYIESTLWATNIVATSNDPSKNYAEFKNDGNLYVYDSAGNQLTSTMTGPISCAPIVPTDISATWGGNVEGVEPGNSTSAVQKKSNGSQSFIYVVGRNQSDPAVGVQKAFDLSYKCGDEIKTKNTKNAYLGKDVVLDCTSSDLPCKCYLILGDDGQVSIYKGDPPGDNDPLIYDWPKYDVSKSSRNKNWDVKYTKTGKNWMAGSTKLYVGEWMASNDGKLLMYMQSDGNLYIRTSVLDEQCAVREDKHAYGEMGSNALYQFDDTPNNDSIGKVGYVDDSGELRVYDSSAIGYLNKYKKYANYDSGGGMGETLNSDAKACANICNSTEGCAGFVFNKDTNTCYTKDNTIYPKSEKIVSIGSDLYVRDIKINNSNSCSKQIVEIDSNTWNGYPQGSAMTTDDSCGLGTVISDPKSKLDSIKTQIDDVASKINDKFTQLQKGNVKLNQDMMQLQQKIGGDLKEYDNVNKMIEQKQNTTTTIDSMLKDSNLVVLQENYKYMAFSIFAVGALVITMNLNRK